MTGSTETLVFASSPDTLPSHTIVLSYSLSLTCLYTCAHMYSTACSFTRAYAACTLLHKKRITSRAPEHAIANPTTRITTLLTHASKRMMLLFNQSISRASSNCCALKPRQDIVCEGPAIGRESDASVSVRLSSALCLCCLFYA